MLYRYEIIPSLIGGTDMKVMVVGGGGREHALIQSLKKSEKIFQKFVDFLNSN